MPKDTVKSALDIQHDELIAKLAESCTNRQDGAICADQKVPYVDCCTSCQAVHLLRHEMKLIDELIAALHRKTSEHDQLWRVNFARQEAGV